MVSRVSTVSVYQQAKDDMSRVQSELAKVNEQISTSREANTFKELGSDISRVVDLETSIKNTQRFVTSNNIAGYRLENMGLALQQMSDIAKDFKSYLVTERSSSGEQLNLTEIAKSMLQQVSDNLNVKYNGRFLFSGAKTNTPAVDQHEVLNSNLIDGEPTASYYQGDNFVFEVRASENLEVKYGITGNDPVFQKFIGAMHAVIEYEANGDDEILAKASELMDDVVPGLADLKSRVDSDKLTLDNSNLQHSRLEVQLQQFLNDTVATDIVQASIDISMNEAILTATMQTFAKTTGLTLANYIK